MVAASTLLSADGARAIIRIWVSVGEGLRFFNAEGTRCRRSFHRFG